MAVKSLGVSELQRVEPELGRIVVLLNMDMGRLKTVGHEEKEAITTLAEHRGHAGMLSLVSCKDAGMGPVDETVGATEVTLTLYGAGRRARPGPLGAAAAGISRPRIRALPAAGRPAAAPAVAHSR